MNAPGPLTTEQIREYDEKGFVTLAPSFSSDELSALRVAADALLRNSGPVVRGNPRLELEQEERMTACPSSARSSRSSMLFRL